MSTEVKANRNLWSRMVFSDFLAKSSAGKRIAFIAVFAALSVICNMWIEFKLFDIQYSVTIFVSLICGVFLGGGAGFAVCLLGDFVGWVVNPGGIYMPWVGLSTATFALISGVLFEFFAKSGGILRLYVVSALICVATFFICTVGINSTGFYLYNNAMGFSTAVLNYASEKFGADVNFPIYLLYRLFFKLQILNSAANYALFLLLLPPILRINIFRRYSL